MKAMVWMEAVITKPIITDGSVIVIITRRVDCILSLEHLVMNQGKKLGVLAKGYYFKLEIQGFEKMYINNACTHKGYVDIWIHFGL